MKPKKGQVTNEQVNLDTEQWRCSTCGNQMIRPVDLVTGEKTNLRERLSANNEEQMALSVCSRCGDIVAMWLHEGQFHSRKLSGEDLDKLPKEYSDQVLAEAIPRKLRWRLKGSPKVKDENN